MDWRDLNIKGKRPESWKSGSRRRKTKLKNWMQEKKSSKKGIASLN
jgi:hypothetical protein